jgi:hypothetical protein
MQLNMDVLTLSCTSLEVGLPILVTKMAYVMGMK